MKSGLLCDFGEEGGRGGTRSERMYEKLLSVCFTTLATKKLPQENLGFRICDWAKPSAARRLPKGQRPKGDHAPESHLRLKQTLFVYPLSILLRITVDLPSWRNNLTCCTCIDKVSLPLSIYNPLLLRFL